jgi:hypothetical protein
MGMLTDLFTATKADARKYEERLVSEKVDLDSIYPRASHKGITGIDLSILFASLLQEPLAGKHLFKVVSSATDDGITEALPQQLVKLLGGLPDSEVDKVSFAWSGHPEVKLSPAELAPLLLDLRSLAGRALSGKKDLFVWYCP